MDPIEAEINEIFTTSIVDIVDKVNHKITYKALVGDINEALNISKSGFDMMIPIRKRIKKCSWDIKAQEGSVNSLKRKVQRMNSDVSTVVKSRNQFRTKLRRVRGPLIKK